MEKMASQDAAKELRDLRQCIANYEQDLKRSSLAYEQLKEENEQLTAQMETLMKENTAKWEELEQERYSLQIKLSQQTKMADSYMEDIESVKVSMLRRQQAVGEKMEREHSNKVDALNRKISSLQSDLEQSHLSEVQLTRAKETLQNLVHQLQVELEAQSNLQMDSCSEEVAILNAELNTLKKDKLLMSRDLIDARGKADQFEMAVTRLRMQLKQQVEETEEKQCQATSYYNSIERLREEIQELKVELDLARMESNNMKKKGNSLFAEVEDRRIEAEKQLISMKVQNESLRKQLEITKQNLYSVKMQVAALLQLSKVHADLHHMEQLNIQLSQATGEVKFLTGKLHESEEREKVLRNELLTLKATSDGGGDGYYVQYLQTLLQRKEREMVELQKELQTQRLLTMAEADNLSRCEQKLYAAEQQAGALRSLSAKQSLKIDEMKLKYEPDSVVTGTLRKVRVERIPLSSSSSASSDKPLEDVAEKQPRLNTEDMAVSDLRSATGVGAAKERGPQSAAICQALPQRGDVDKVRNDSASAPMTSLHNSGPNSAKIESNSSSLSAQTLTSDSDQKENETSPLLKSILIQQSDVNFVQPKPSGVSKTSKKVTMSPDVQVICGLTNEISHCSSLKDEEEEHTKKSEPAGSKQIKGRQAQSRIVSVKSEGELISKDDCKTQ